MPYKEIELRLTLCYAHFLVLHAEPYSNKTWHNYLLWQIVLYFSTLIVFVINYDV